MQSHEGAVASQSSLAIVGVSNIMTDCCHLCTVVCQQWPTGSSCDAVSRMVPGQSGDCVNVLVIK